MAFLARMTGDKKYLDKSNEIYAQYLQVPRSPNGGVSHRAETVELWDDTAYMLNMFLLEMYRLTGGENTLQILLSSSTRITKNPPIPYPVYGCTDGMQTIPATTTRVAASWAVLVKPHARAAKSGQEVMAVPIWPCPVHGKRSSKTPVTGNKEADRVLVLLQQFLYRAGEADMYLFKEVRGTYMVGNDSTHFGPGKQEYKSVQLRGALPAADAPTVYLTGFIHSNIPYNYPESR